MAFLTSKLFGYILAAAALLATGFGIGAKWQGTETNKVKREFAEYKFTQADYLAKVVTENDRRTKALREELAKQDKEHYEQLEKSKADAAALRRAVRDGERRLSIRATCPPSSTPGRPATPAAPGLDDEGTGRADIHREDAEALIAIGNDADELRQQLTALQDWVKTHDRSQERTAGHGSVRGDHSSVQKQHPRGLRKVERGKG